MCSSQIYVNKYATLQSVLIIRDKEIGSDELPVIN
jgi:hypothetical protein